MFINRPLQELITSTSYFLKTADIIIEKKGDRARAIDRYGNRVAEGDSDILIEIVDKAPLKDWHRIHVSGHHVVSDTIAVPPDHPIVVTGDSYRASIVEAGFGGTRKPLFRLRGGNQASALIDVAFVGNDADPAILVDNVDGYQSLVYLHRVATAVYGVGMDANRGIVSKSDVLVIEGGMIVGIDRAIDIEGGTDVYIAKAGISATGQNGYAVYVPNTVSPLLSIEQCSITVPLGVGIRAHGLLNLRDSWLDECGARCVEMHVVAEPVIQGNRFYTKGDHVIYGNGVDGGVIGPNSYDFDPANLAALIKLEYTNRPPLLVFRKNDKVESNNKEYYDVDRAVFRFLEIAGSINSPLDLTAGISVTAGRLIVKVPSGTALNAGHNVFTITNRFVRYDKPAAKVQVISDGSIGSPFAVMAYCDPSNDHTIVIDIVVSSSVTLSSDLKLIIELT